jgi:hypothetical protein
MREERIGAVIVAEDGMPLGVVTDRDLAVRVIAEQRDPSTVELRDIMSRDAIFLSKHRSLDDAITTMHELGVRRLPIVDEHGRLEGMLSMDDVLILLAEQLGRLGELVRSESYPPSDAEQGISPELAELHRFPDELRLKLRHVEPRLQREGNGVTEAAAQLVKELRAAVGRFSDRVTRVAAPISPSGG